MNKKLISKCCDAQIYNKGAPLDGKNLSQIEGYCCKCGFPCELIEVEQPTRKQLDGECVMAKVYPHHEPIQKQEEVVPSMFIDYHINKNCKNLPESFGEICVKCGKCGRKFERGQLVSEPTPSDTFIEEGTRKKIDFFIEVYSGKEFDKDIMRERIKEILKSSLQSQRQSILEEIEKVKERYRCGACDGANCNHSLTCRAIEDIKKILI